MKRILRWVLLSIGLIVVVLAICWAKLSHEVGIAFQDELNHRFSMAAAKVKILDVGLGTQPPPLSEHDRALMGAATVDEFLMSARVSGYWTEHGILPASIEQLDSDKRGRQASPLDPWGSPFRLIVTNGRHFLIVSGGPSHVSNLSSDEMETIRRQQPNAVYGLHGKIISDFELLDPSTSKDK